MVRSTYSLSWPSSWIGSECGIEMRYSAQAGTAGTAASRSPRTGGSRSFRACYLPHYEVPLVVVRTRRATAS
jgi:hypothetical protein